MKSLAKEPRDRYPNGAALIAALESAEQQTAVAPLKAAPSIMERVALDMEHLPPPPAGSPGIQTPQPAMAKTAPSFVMPPPPTQEVQEPTIAPAPTQATDDAPLWPKLAGVGGIILLLLLLLGGASLLGGDEEPADDVAGVAPTHIVISDTATATTAIPEATAVAIAIADVPSATPLPEVNPTAALETNPTPTAVGNTEVAASTTSPTATPPPTETPAPRTFEIVIDRDKDTLFITNIGTTPLPLPALTLTFKDDNRLNNWTLDTLPPNACVLLVKNDKSPSDKIDKTPCQQIAVTLDFDWEDQFSVSYQGAEIDTCQVKGKNNCQLEWQSAYQLEGQPANEQWLSIVISD